MKKDDQNKLMESQEAIFQGLKKLLAEHNLEHLEISSLEIEMPENTVEDAMFTLAEIVCPVGYKKVIKIHPITGAQKVVCVPR